MARPRLPIVVKGYPRLSETFIAQEMLELERLGLEVEIWSLRRPTDGAVHAMHRAIRANVHYLPEYLYQAPLRVLRGALAALAQPGLARLLATFWRDLRRDPTANRGRRLGQALVFARELDAGIAHIYVHYLHTPASVARYAAILSGRSFSFSAHAKDIWTTEDWEKREKIADSAFGFTCTRQGLAELRRLAPPEDQGRVSLVYHGLDLSRFPTPPHRAPRKGDDPAQPVEIVTVGRAVAKKGFDDLLRALALLDKRLHWRLTHIGTGELRAELAALAAELALSPHVTFAGSKPQSDVISALRAADLFVLPVKEGDGGDRDGLPNVIMEAATQGLAIVSTDFAGVPEFITSGENGLLVPPGNPPALAAAIGHLIERPEERAALGRAARATVETGYSFQSGVAEIAARLESAMRAQGGPGAA